MSTLPVDSSQEVLDSAGAGQVIISRVLAPVLVSHLYTVGPSVLLRSVLQGTDVALEGRTAEAAVDLPQSA